MGLDLTLYTKADWRRVKDGQDADYLCYGRKTWSIYQFFAERELTGEGTVSNDDSLIELDYGAIEDFINIIRPYRADLERWVKAFYDYENSGDNTEDAAAAELRAATPRVEKFLTEWVNAGGSNDFTLGQDSEFSAMIDWYDNLTLQPKHRNRRYIMNAWY